MTRAERFKTINAAYEVLSDADKREKYYRYGRPLGSRPSALSSRAVPISPSSSGAATSAAAARAGSESPPEGRPFLTCWAGWEDSPRTWAAAGASGSGRGRRTWPVEITLEEADHGTTRLVNLPDGRRLEVKIPAGIADGGRVHVAGRATRPAASSTCW